MRFEPLKVKVTLELRDVPGPASLGRSLDRDTNVTPVSVSPPCGGGSDSRPSSEASPGF